MGYGIYFDEFVSTGDPQDSDCPTYYTILSPYPSSGGGGRKGGGCGDGLRVRGGGGRRGCEEMVFLKERKGLTEEDLFCLQQFG